MVCMHGWYACVFECVHTIELGKWPAAHFALKTIFLSLRMVARPTCNAKRRDEKASAEQHISKQKKHLTLRHRIYIYICAVLAILNRWRRPRVAAKATTHRWRRATNDYYGIFTLWYYSYSLIRASIRTTAKPL